MPHGACETRNWFTRNFLIGKAFLQLKSINARQGWGVSGPQGVLQEAMCT